MSSYIQKALLPGEHVVYAATLHWIIYLQGLAFTAIGGLFGYKIPYILNYLFGPDMAQEYTRPLALVTLGFILVGIVLLLGAYIRQTSTELVVTNRRVIAKYGFVSRMTYELMVTRVTGANFDQTVWGRLLGFGTIIIHGAGGDISPIDHIASPQLFHNKLMGVLENWQGKEAPGGRD